MAGRNGTGESHESLDFTRACGLCEAAGLRIGVSKSSICTSGFAGVVCIHRACE